MGKRRKRKFSSTLTWKITKGFFHLLFQGIFKAAPLLIFGLIGFGIFWGIRQELYADPGFQIEHLEIVPEGVLSHERIHELDQKYHGKNLFKISLPEISAELVREPEIRQARVERMLPRTLRIEIATRSPFLQIRLGAGGTYYLADEEGVILASSPTPKEEFLLVEAPGFGKGRLRRGEELALPGLKEGVALAKAFWKHPLSRSESLERVHLGRIGDVTLVLKRGPELRFGLHPMEKFYMLDHLDALLKGPDRDKIVYIELQYQDLVVKKK